MSIIITLLIQLYLHRRTYKDEYYKKILDKRLLAYERLELLLINKFRTWDKYEENIFYTVFNTIDQYKEFYTNLEEMFQLNLWLNKPLRIKIMEFSNYLSDEINVDIIKYSDEEIRKRGTVHFSKLTQLLKDIRKLYFMDIKKLYKLNDFHKE